MRIGKLSSEERPLLVAEIGNNHEGDVEAARSLFRHARDAGADAVKLQIFAAERMVRPSDPARLEQLRRFQLDPDAVVELAGLARELGLAFVATPLDLESVELLEPLVDAFKIASGDNDFWALLDLVGATTKPVIVSSGLSDLAGIARAKERVEAAGGGGEVGVLHCVSAYPASPESANLAAIGVLRAQLGCTVGYSDHLLGIEGCLAAVAVGAEIVEKHFTLAHDYSEFRDHQLSANPAELAELAGAMIRFAALRGTAIKEIQDEEEPLLTAARRSIVAATDLDSGTTLTGEDLAWLRPRDGLAPGDEEQLIGRRLRRDVARGESLTAADLEA